MGQTESTSEFQITAQWEWQSNKDPFSSEEPQWAAYKPLDNYLLEKAYAQEKDEVDLGDYIVSTNALFQRRKENSYLQRPVRRNTEYFKMNASLAQKEDIRAKRFYGAEKPKTFNKAFGNLSDYLNFFQNRGPEIKKFAKLFNEIESSKNINQLNQVILPWLVDCIKSEAKESAKMMGKDQLLDQGEEERDYLLLLQNIFTSVKEFYACILKAYTMEGFLYRNVNRYLRNEDWIQLDTLLPYAYCICKAFLSSELVDDSSNLDRQLPSDSDENSILYRGTPLDEATINCYNPKIATTFCWNSVTSTSRNRAVAERFMCSNLGLASTKPVMFIIEVPGGNEALKKANWIDIKSYSVMENEDEVILRPGSVFELTKVRKSKSIEIYLKLIANVNKLAYQGQIMHGAFNSKMASDIRLQLVCLEEKEILEAMAHLRGNRLIEELEFCLCQFNYNAGSAIAETLMTVPNLKKLILISPSSTDQTHWNIVLKQIGKTHTQTVEIYDSLSVLNEDQFCWTNGIKSLTSIASLTLDFNLTFYSECVGFFSFAYMASTKWTRNLCSQLKYLTSLKSLTLCFERGTGIQDEHLKILSAQGIKHLPSLTFLTLDFSGRREITDEGLNHLSLEGLKYLTSLTSLTLNFHDCFHITDEGLNHLSKEGLKYLTSLTALNLNFGWCKLITDDGLSNLCCEGIKNLTLLTSLTLNFEWSKITDHGLDDLCCEGIKYLTSLTFSDLNFEDCSKISDAGRKKLKRPLFQEKRLSLPKHAYMSFTKSVALKREFPSGSLNCNSNQKQISISADIVTLNSKRKLQSFIENTPDSQRFASPQQNFLIDVKLCLTIKDCQLTMKLINSLTSIRSLSLDFETYSTITEKELSSLVFERLKNLTSLISLTLDFHHCTKITDKGLNNLCFQSIKYLTSLTSLNLSFKGCLRITDEGLNILCCKGIKHLASLTSLSLCFDSCKNITDAGLGTFHKVLTYFGYQPV